MLAMVQSDALAAAQHFGSSVSIFDMLGDRYRAARAHYELGRAYALDSAQPGDGTPYRGRSIPSANSVRELDLARAEEGYQQSRTAVRPSRIVEQSALTQLLTLRLAEAVASRELLLRELAAIMRQETTAKRVVITEQGEHHRPRVVIAHGCTADGGRKDRRGTRPVTYRRRTRELRRARMTPPSFRFDLPTLHPQLYTFRLAAGRKLPGGMSMEPLLRVVGLGMDVCALRAGASKAPSNNLPDELAGTGLMPGFIHSSPAMTRLVEEVHKIRSSDVTVLVTGESGTGKELVARAIHALSSRRSKVFVPFNCTAVPKELSEGYLFGYRRGAFTGAVADSAGVIRTAAGGTLFLDEIGDLPLDLQPKLLGFCRKVRFNRWESNAPSRST